MTDDALATDRLIGIIQPATSEAQGNQNSVFKTGCAGRITAFSETDDKILHHLIWFGKVRCGEEISTSRGYRRVLAGAL